jgi:hypothetical protein
MIPDTSPFAAAQPLSDQNITDVSWYLTGLH